MRLTQTLVAAILATAVTAAPVASQGKRNPMYESPDLNYVATEKRNPMYESPDLNYVATDKKRMYDSPDLDYIASEKREALASGAVIEA
ncbi:hypothetical protein M409DRAFT_19528 [Zasmidium cellare ATCC 36951]|uniref:Uncharacterized protein n=1 Tax=Zasmidium cellare ATCC 36951 TaxID=1080233 RepID=A0A6A6CU84_ZASCE|nr:uncharacterized protein M409DRAFT_19528 [Zasmidium cellare ATCC 36951]KAF2170714.1 hypothetical protein M409DRAFT_19528 [Zasmidium cellare ATCC 36951]